MALTKADIEEEERHFFNVITTFRNYARYSLSANNRRRKDIYRLPLADQQVLDQLGYKAKLDEVDKAIEANARFLNLIAENPEMFGHDQGEDVEETVDEGATRNEEGNEAVQSSLHSHSHPQAHDSPGPAYKPTEFDMDKLRSTLKQFVRDWSEEGKEEREACYKPIKDALNAHFANVPSEERSQLRVLVPGAGLGRLAWDVTSMGYACQANEFSHYMLLGSYLILNKTKAPNQHTLYPYIHSFSNVDSRKTILRAIQIPDVTPSALPQGVDFSLIAGDFEEIYGDDDVDPSEPQAGKWDAILTCFFIDTAKNIVNYLRIIHRILAPGGVWINLGPLLWHWENNNTNDTSIELDLQEVKALAQAIGFKLSNERTIDATYTNNSEGMLRYIYRAEFWTATKVEEGMKEESP